MGGILRKASCRENFQLLDVSVSTWKITKQSEQCVVWWSIHFYKHQPAYIILFSFLDFFLLKISLCYMASINAIEKIVERCLSKNSNSARIYPHRFFIYTRRDWAVGNCPSFHPASSLHTIFFYTCLEQIFSCSFFLLSLSIYISLIRLLAARAHFPMGPFISFRGSALALHVWPDLFLMGKVYLRCVYTAFRSKCFYETLFVCVCVWQPWK